MLKNYGNFVFVLCEIGEIITFINVLFKGFFPLMKNLKNIQKNLYFKTNIKNPPKKKYNNYIKSNKNILTIDLNESSKRNILNVTTNNNNDIIIYNKIGIYKNSKIKS